MEDCNKALKAPFIHCAEPTEQRADQVVCFGSDDLGHVRVPEHKVSIRAHCYATLAGEQIKDLCCICAGHCHKLVFVHFTSYLLESEKKSDIRIQTGLTHYEMSSILFKKV